MSNIVTDQQFLRMKSIPATPEEVGVLIKVLEEELTKHRTGIGLSAVQIGLLKQVAIVRCNGKSINLINPKIIDAETPILSQSEGCLSIPGRSIDVERYGDYVLINNKLSEDGKSFIEEKLSFHIDYDNQHSDGLFGIAIQHEIDHMDGVLIIDKIKKMEPIQVIHQQGRNERCNCGSGKKYKHCCGSNK